jgi:UDP-N-acetylmuramoyl-tripeptide--D-alanyl-D-alanine ligase
MSIDSKFLTAVIPSAEILYNPLPTTVTFTVDSRTVTQGQIFVALQGVQQDGHDFLAGAIEKGCAGLLMAHEKKNKLASLDAAKLKNLCIILVPDPLQALISLATVWRQQFSTPVVAITGSIGKTSTKNILGAILKHNGNNYLVSHGNQNTVIGVALNLLRLNPSHDGALFEVGINQRGEMARIITMLRPTSALITYIGHSHMEGLGTLSDIAVEKREIFKFFQENNIGFVNGDLPILAQVAYPHPVIKFGLKTTNQIQARKVVYDSFSATGVLKIYKDKYPIKLPNNHAGALLNTLGAVAVAHHLGVPNEVIVDAIQKPIIVEGRFERRQLKSFKGLIINDCYNASPESMKAALLAFQKVETGAQKIAILGDMLELGSDSAFWHRQLGRFLRKVPTVKQVILVGSMTKWTKKTVPVGVSVVLVPSWQEALVKVQEFLAQESIILVKGSRGVGLYNLVNNLAEPVTQASV